ncbi:MAG: MarR family transcriptional regulator [Firmicutes bacterium]|nr:MarR family transcriptional regulator [Bacillota bacterium]
MKKDIRSVIESWSGVEEIIMSIIRRDEKQCSVSGEDVALSGHRFDALAVIAFLNVHSVTMIAKMVGCSKSAVSIMISKMMSGGLIEKKYGHNIQDNRSIYIDITQKGKETLEKFMRVRLEAVSRGYDLMNDTFKKELNEGMACLCKVYNYSDGFLVEMTRDIANAEEYSEGKRAYIINFANFVANRLSGEKTISENPGKMSKNLTLQQITMLKAIYLSNKNTVSKLVKHFGTSVSTVSVNVSRLAKAGFVVKEYGKTDDNRETIISLTDKAKTELKDIARKYYDIFLKEYNSMTAEQQRTLEEGLEHFDRLVNLIKTEGKSL